MPIVLGGVKLFAGSAVGRQGRRDAGLNTIAAREKLEDFDGVRRADA
jgi:hypothetical protein